MQRIAARVALDERRPTRSLLDIAAHIEEDAAAPVATSRGSRVQAYDGALPQLESGAIHPRIDPEPAGASVALALAMAEAGFQPRGALPEAPSPHEWIVRVIDALQLTDRATVSTPADWQPGERVIVAPTISTEDAREKFGEVEEVTPYLRWTPEPAA